MLEIYHRCVRHAPNFVEKTFTGDSKSTKFVNVFSLKSFLLYGIINCVLSAHANFFEAICPFNYTTTCFAIGILSHVKIIKFFHHTSEQQRLNYSAALGILHIAFWSSKSRRNLLNSIYYI